MKLDFKDIVNKFSSPWLVAFIPFFITLFFTTAFFNKYNLQLLSTDSIEQNLCYYDDLDKNGNSEYLQFYTYINAQLLIYDLNQKLEDVYDLPGKWFNGHEGTPTFFIGDMDNDNLGEIFAFTINDNDSLFVSIIKHYPQKKILKNKFILTLPKSGGTYDYILTPLGLEDNNGDKFPELLFVINAGFPLQPRAVFAWDIKNDSIYRSPLMGNGIKCRPENIYFEDLNGDSIKEIFLRTVATKNYNDSISIPFSDQNSWIMIFSKNLEFLFEPVQIEGPQTEIYNFPVESGDSLLIGVQIYNDRAENKHPTFQMYNPCGVKVDEIDLPYFKNGKYTGICKMNKKYYIINGIDGDLEISILNNKLDKIVNSIVFPTSDYYLYLHDIDSDGEIEILVYTFIDEKLNVIRGDLENVTETTVRYKKLSIINKISLAHKNQMPQHILMVTDGMANYLAYSRNPMYYLNFVLAVLYYLFLVFAFTRLKKVWLLNLLQKQHTEQEMQYLQMQTVMNQLNPHFTYNAINTVGSAILNSEPQKAYDSLTRVSRLFRRVVDHAFQPYKTLEEEIDFVRDYLEVEKSRFGTKLYYDINV
ncbi:MAG TPA: histidine kinase, partial [Draconibacterium sp.]|nr:histidine kinase [Draconibacterium sp.]